MLNIVTIHEKSTGAWELKWRGRRLRKFYCFGDFGCFMCFFCAYPAKERTLFENDFCNFVETLGDLIGGSDRYCYD